MTLALLRDIREVTARYAAERAALDAAVLANDVGKKVLHWERLCGAGAEFLTLAERFTIAYAVENYQLEELTPVVWRRGAVGLQGTLLDSADNPGALVAVDTKHGVFMEYACNLMPLSKVTDTHPKEITT